MCITLLSRKRYRQMLDELSELHIQVRTAQEKIKTMQDHEKNLSHIIDGDRGTINDLHKRIETQQRIIDKLNTGQIKPNPNKSATLAALNAKKEDHDPYPEE